eukprot:831192-Pleurochrysis_carterae.AAC.1
MPTYPMGIVGALLQPLASAALRCLSQTSRSCSARRPEAAARAASAAARNAGSGVVELEGTGEEKIAALQSAAVDAGGPGLEE